MTEWCGHEVSLYDAFNQRHYCKLCGQSWRADSIYGTFHRWYVTSDGRVRAKLEILRHDVTREEAMLKAWKLTMAT